MGRYSFRKKKLSTRNLERLCRENASEEPTLVVHSEDVDYKPYFPNAFAVTKRPDKPADLHVDPYYTELDRIADGAYDVIVCTGLLEHVPDPARLIADLHRILRPGGKLVISASAVFSFHEGPDNFFHFTPHAFRLLFRDWSRIEMLRGASQPFETIGILLQRVLMQCEIFPPLRPLIELMAGGMRHLDRFVGTQYDNTWNRTPEHEIDSMLPSNIQAVIIK
ncbi:class I SAM-dependent methyltransferase [Devosia sp.]|uniref:class I SAM-dependent methyltransferase n=1 Tax=Devosia sp. TaxID=1871048 RepID=UPI002EDD223A